MTYNLLAIEVKIAKNSFASDRNFIKLSSDFQFSCSMISNQ